MPHALSRAPGREAAAFETKLASNDDLWRGTIAERLTTK